MFKVCEYLCGSCGTRSDSLEERSAVAETKPCPCGGVGERVISAPRVLTTWASAERRGTNGGFSVDEAPPGALDTRDYARRHGVDV